MLNCIHFRGKVLEMKLRSGKNYLRLRNPVSISSHVYIPTYQTHQLKKTCLNKEKRKRYVASFFLLCYCYKYFVAILCWYEFIKRRVTFESIKRSWRLGGDNLCQKKNASSS